MTSPCLSDCGDCGVCSNGTSDKQGDVIT
jgi:hypothetical protein